jgi:hypothetical protein
LARLPDFLTRPIRHLVDLVNSRAGAHGGFVNRCQKLRERRAVNSTHYGIVYECIKVLSRLDGSLAQSDQFMGRKINCHGHGVTFEAYSTA